MKVDYERYVRDSETTMPDGTRERTILNERVDAAHVHRFLDARSFFEAGGWTEERKRRNGGVLVIDVTEPDGTRHTTVFTPIIPTSVIA